jgi:hypothetical protein
MTTETVMTKEGVKTVAEAQAVAKDYQVNTGVRLVAFTWHPTVMIMKLFKSLRGSTANPDSSWPLFIREDLTKPKWMEGKGVGYFNWTQKTVGEQVDLGGSVGKCI